MSILAAYIRPSSNSEIVKVILCLRLFLFALFFVELIFQSSFESFN